MRPANADNFCRVFELPTNYPEGFCFNGGKPVQMLMVDFFHPWPSDFPYKSPDTWAEVVEILRPFLLEKKYVKPGRLYVLVTDFNESMVFSRPNGDLKGGA